jgi:hypothetical protein
MPEKSLSLSGSIQLKLESNDKFNMLKRLVFSLLKYCQSEDWAGYDPYDALNSNLIKGIPFLDSRIPRLVLTQLMKKSPINFRPMLLVPKTHNPKALALFLMTFLNLSKGCMLKEGYLIDSMVTRLINLRSHSTPHWAWGYSFPWQTRTMLVPRGDPSLVCTYFVANALFDTYEWNLDPKCLAMATDAAEYILRFLYWTHGNHVAGFAYPLPSSRSQIHNANLLGSALLCRAHKFTGDDKFLEPALRVARYSASRQNPDGSWFYGEAIKQHWVDNFHTGYNLLALLDIKRFCKTSEFDPSIQSGYHFYRRNFFGEDSAPKYFYNQKYPIDIHCVAQSIITLEAFSRFDESSALLSQNVLTWAMTHMWDDKGYFYYQVHPTHTNKISYMRWSQAWMLLALSISLLRKTNLSEKLPERICW